MRKTTVYLPIELHRALGETARAQRRSRRQSYSGWLWKATWDAENKQPLPLSAGVVGADAGLSGADSEDRFRAEWGGL